MDTKTALLDAAENAVRRRGYDGFSYADLAKEVGIRKPSIHHHYPTKADLGEALIGHYSDRFLGALTKIEEEGSAAEQLAAYLTLYRDALGNGEMVCLCVALSSERDSLSEPILRVLNEFHDASGNWLERLYSRGASDQTIVSVADPALEAVATLALVEGAQLMARAAGSTENFDAATRLLRARLT